MSNIIFSFIITAKKGKDAIGGTTQVYSCDNIEDARKVAVEIAKARWIEHKGWTDHYAKLTR